MTKKTQNITLSIQHSENAHCTDFFRIHSSTSKRVATDASTAYFSGDLCEASIARSAQHIVQALRDTKAEELNLRVVTAMRDVASFEDDYLRAEIGERVKRRESVLSEATLDALDSALNTTVKRASYTLRKETDEEKQAKRVRKAVAKAIKEQEREAERELKRQAKAVSKAIKEFKEATI